MAISNSEWQAIQDFVNGMLSKVGSPFVQGKVIKSDPIRKVVFLKEFGSTPIPIIGFDYQVKYSFKEPAGTLTVKKTKAYTKDVEILTPQVGDIVLVAQQFGSSRLPKCLGVVKSRNYVETQE
jgi:hypothetical protein